ncbi:hypothetical protein ACQJBY_036020 [Aegilops geniculata]
MSQDQVKGTLKAGQDWNTTITNWSRDAKDFWETPGVTALRIKVLVSLVAGVLLFLAFFGSRRRRSKNGFIQKGLLGAYTLSFHLTTYIMGYMQSSELKSRMYAIWAISLLMLHTCTDSITHYSLDDIKQRTRLQYQAFMYFLYTSVLLGTMVRDHNSTLPSIYGLLAIIPSLAFLRYMQRLAVCILAGYSWNLNKTVADYMYDQKNESVSDPPTMEGCSYLVDWPLIKSKFDAPTYATQSTVEYPDEKYEVIDIGKIWRCKDKPLGPELKDACLSFSLFHLLRRRYFGFACDESKDRARHFVLEVLLPEYKLEGATDYNRLFKVIDVELAYMYDFFFTKYAVIYYESMAATIWSLTSAIIISVMVYITVKAPVKISQQNSSVMTNITIDIFITLVMLASAAFLELLQLYLFWAGIWGRVSFVCQFLREHARLNGRASQVIGNRTRGSYYDEIMGFLANIGVCLASCILELKKVLANIGLSDDHHWEHKLGQYSLLDSVSYYYRGPVLRRFVFWILGNRIRLGDVGMKPALLIDRVFNQPLNVKASMVRNKVGKSVELPDEVKESIIGSLERTRGTLSNGRSLLQSNGAQHLSWACDWVMHLDENWSQRKQNQTHIILTWHIATCYCETLTVSPDGPEELNLPFSIASCYNEILTLFRDRSAELEVPSNIAKHFSVATKLSKYCAYLVVSAPKLLPGHHYDTRIKFNAAVVEAIELLPKSMSTYKAIKSLKVPKETEKIFESGVKLGKQLENMVEGTRWKVMADFWAEMILYLAPSANVEEHIEQLAQGGEFITHLLALLSHAGILEREEEHQAGEACNQHRVDSFVSAASSFCQCECV